MSSSHVAVHRSLFHSAILLKDDKKTAVVRGTADSLENSTVQLYIRKLPYRWESPNDSHTFCFFPAIFWDETQAPSPARSTLRKTRLFEKGRIALTAPYSYVKKKSIPWIHNADQHAIQWCSHMVFRAQLVLAHISGRLRLQIKVRYLYTSTWTFVTTSFFLIYVFIEASSVSIIFTSVHIVMSVSLKNIKRRRVIMLY